MKDQGDQVEQDVHAGLPPQAIPPLLPGGVSMPPAAQPPIDPQVLDKGRLALKDLPKYNRLGTWRTFALEFSMWLDS